MRIDTQVGTVEVVEKGNGIEIEAPQDATLEETMMIGHHEGIGIFLMTEEVAEADGEVTEGIAKVDLEMALHETVKRAPLHHRRRRSLRPI